jgi:type IV secretory pathway TrbD component
MGVNGSIERPKESGGFTVGLILAILLLAIIFGAVGFAVHLLWIVAAIVLVLWLVGFAARSGDGRWYRW